MVELQPRGIGEHGLEIGRGIVAVGAEADEMLVAAAVRDLHQAEPVAAELKAHRLGVDGDRTGAEHAGGQVFFVEMDAHALRIGHAHERSMALSRRHAGADPRRLLPHPRARGPSC